jgi:dihydrofolate synthase/folylpolyglutamate synthase
VLGDRRPRVAVIGVLEDKDAAAMLAELLPHVDLVVYTRSQNPRSLSPATLASLAEKLDGPSAKTAADPHAAVSHARALAGPGGAVVATGSIYVIADLVRADPNVRASSM